jgi:hypothetical protein
MYCVILQNAMAVNIPITACSDMALCGVVDRYLTIAIHFKSVDVGSRFLPVMYLSTLLSRVAPLHDSNLNVMN